MSRRLAYEPALDGVRGAAVAIVVAFHLGAPWASAGFLGVSVFFTLSGYLITRLLLDELADTGSVDLRAFWSRRARRLLPAAVVTLVATLVAVAVWEPESLNAVRADAVAAALQVANWRFVADGRSYGDLFAEPSPLLHFWSLAIEEQFYWAFPVVVAGAAGAARRLGRHPVAAITVAVTGVGVAGVCAMVWWAPDPDLTYYTTPARLPEIVLGSLAGIALSRPSRRDRPSGRTGAWAAGVVGGAAIVVLGALVATTGVSDGFYARGGLALVAIPSVALLWSVTRPGPLARALSWRPLVAVGTVSYGLYLFHWPVIQLVDEQRTGIEGPTLVLVRLLVTAGLTVASHRLVEGPIRTGRWPASVRPVRARAAVAAVASVVVLSVALGPLSLPAPYDFDGAGEDLAAAASVAAAPSTVVAGAPSSPPQRVAVFGDSTARMVAWGLLEWARVHPGELAYVGGVAELGCGIGRDGQRRYVGRDFGPVPTTCADWASTWPSEVRATEADVAVVLAGPWDISDRILPGETVIRTVGDRVYDDYLRSELLAALDALAATGVDVVWLTSPRIDPQTDFGGAPLTEPLPVADPARTERFNELVREVADLRPALAVADLAAWTQDQPDGEPGDRLRPDGIHFSFTTAPEVARDFLVPYLLGRDPG